MGGAVFDRDTRGVVTNAAGEMLLPYARQVLASLNDFSNKALRAATGEIGRLKIAYNEIAIRTILPTILSKYRETYPNVDLRLLNQATSEMCPENTPGSVHRGDVDVGFLVGPVLDPELESLELLEDRLVVVVSKNHRLATAVDVSVRELEHEHILLWATEPWQLYTNRINDLCRTAGFLPRPTILVEDNEGAFALVEAELGIVMIAETAARLYADRVAIVPLKEKARPFQLCAAWRKDNSSPALQNFLALVEQATGSI